MTVTGSPTRRNSLKLISDAAIGSSVSIEFLRDGKRQIIKVPIERQVSASGPGPLAGRRSRTPAPAPDILAITLALTFAAAIAGAAALAAGRVARRCSPPSATHRARTARRSAPCASSA